MFFFFPDLLEQLILLLCQTPYHLQAGSLSDKTRLIHNYIKRQLIPDLVIQCGLLRNEKGHRLLK